MKLLLLISLLPLIHLRYLIVLLILNQLHLFLLLALKVNLLRYLLIIVIIVLVFLNYKNLLNLIKQTISLLIHQYQTFQNNQDQLNRFLILNYLMGYFLLPLKLNLIIIKDNVVLIIRQHFLSYVIVLD